MATNSIYTGLMVASSPEGLPSFPALSSFPNPDQDGFNGQAKDDTITSNTDGGYTYSRPRNTNFDIKTWNFSYSLLSDDDRSEVDAFRRRVGNCAGLFQWVHPITGELYICRMTKTPKEEYQSFYGLTSRWKISFTIESHSRQSPSYSGFLTITGTQNGVNTKFAIALR